MAAKIPDIPQKKTWRDDPVTSRQLRMMAWLLDRRGIIYKPSRGTTSPMDLTKGQASKLIDKLLSHADDDEIIKLLEANDMVVTGRKKMKRSWQELVAEDVFERSLK